MVLKLKVIRLIGILQPNGQGTPPGWEQHDHRPGMCIRGIELHTFNCTVKCNILVCHDVSSLRLHSALLSYVFLLIVLSVTDMK